MLDKFLIKENKKENEYTELFLSNVKLTQKWLKEAFLRKEKFESLSKKDKLIFEKIFSKNDYIIYNKNFNVKNRKEKIIDLDLFLEKYKLLREYCHKYNVSILDKYSISADSKKLALQKFLQENKKININEYTYKNILVKNIITIIN